MDVLTPADARTVAFNARRKGYDEGEVDAFVDHVCESLAEYVGQIEQLRLDVSTAREAEDAAAAELASTREELASLRARVEELTKEADDARAETQRVSDELASVREELAEAQAASGSAAHVRDSVALLAAAQETADKLTEAAREEAERLREENDRVKAETENEARRRAADIAATFHDLHVREESFRTELRGLLSALSDLVDADTVVSAEAGKDVEELFGSVDGSSDGNETDGEPFSLSPDNDSFSPPQGSDELLVEQTMEIPVVVDDSDGSSDEGGSEEPGSDDAPRPGETVSGGYGW